MLFLLFVLVQATNFYHNVGVFTIYFNKFHNHDKVKFWLKQIKQKINKLLIQMRQ